MGIVISEKLNEHGVVASSEMAFYYLGNLTQTFHHVIVHGTFFQIDTYIGTCGITYHLRIHVIARTQNRLFVRKLAYSLMDNGT